MIRSVGDLDQYKYTINDIVISKKGTNEQLVIPATFIKSITIVNNYDQNIMPIIQVVASVTKDVYKALTIDEANLKALLVMYKSIVNSEVPARELVFNKTFEIRNEYDVQPEEFRTFLNEKEDENIIDSENPNALVDASFYLLDIENINRYRKLGSLSVNTTMTNALAAAFASRGFNSVLMNRINGEYSGNIVVPTGNLLATLSHLNKYYGIFDTNYIFFMDITKNYLLDKINLGKAVEENEPSRVSLFLEEDGSPEQTDVGCTKENEAYVVNITEPPKVVKLDNYSELVDGSSILSVDANTLQVTNINGGEGSLAKPVFVQNQKITRQLQHISKEIKHALLVNLIDVDYDMIRPNLLYKVTAHKSYESINPINGDYRLSHAVINITKATDNEFSLTTNLTLKKIVK